MIQNANGFRDISGGMVMSVNGNPKVNLHPQHASKLRTDDNIAMINSFIKARVTMSNTGCNKNETKARIQESNMDFV